MGRPRLTPGNSGKTWIVDLPDGRYQAVAGYVISMGGCVKSLPSAQPTLDMTLDQLGAYWIRHRQRHGKARIEGRLRDSTLGAYDAALRTVL